MKTNMNIPTMNQLFSQGKSPEVLFWIGCAGSFDQRAQRVIRSFAKILHQSGVDFAVLGTEEGCTGDPAKRSGNEFLFQIQAMSNIKVLNGYGVKKIVTTCAHCFNTLKNEYPSLGGNYQVMHHTEFLKSLLEQGRIRVEGGFFKGKRITYHDPCYLGRANGVYEAPREVLRALEADLVEMKKCKSSAFCCGAGGGQMFKESERGTSEINVVRAEQALEKSVEYVAVSCPFCCTMISDGMKAKKREDVQVLDIAEMISKEIE